MSLPSFLIIGAMKAGTSSLHSYLSEHPEIFMSKEKELNFFNTSLNWNKGVDWYQAQFDATYKVRGETSPNYTKWEGTAARVHSILPNIKIIYLLRHPVERFVSDCNDKQIDPNKVVEDLKRAIHNDIFTTGLYYKWYQDYLKFYAEEHILLVNSEKLRHHRQETLTTIFNFLEVDANVYEFQKRTATTESHVTSQKKIAGGSIKSLNNSKIFSTIKQFAAPLIPLLKPVWNRIFYKERIIRDLTGKNKAYLESLYQADMDSLTSERGIIFNASNA